MTIVLENKNGNRVQFTVKNPLNIKGAFDRYKKSGHKIVAVNY